MKQLLVVEDDQELNASICYMLKKAGYDVATSCTIQEAKEQYLAQPPHLILLDVNLPDGEGFTFCQWVKKDKRTPVIFLTARDLEEDALTGYELGAEDYITKPFSMNILLKKIGLILKRQKEQGYEVFTDGFLKIDAERAKVFVKEVECQVTPTEYRLLKVFLANKGQLLTYGVLMEQLWDCKGQFVDKHTLAVNVNRLRMKIEDEEHKYISNVYGMGYQWLKG